MTQQLLWLAEQQPVAENVLGEPADIPDEVSDGETADSTTDYIPPQHLGLQTDPLSERKVSTWECSPTMKFLEVFQWVYF